MLGCAGMTDLARDLERKAGVPVLDGLACAVSLAESLVRVRLRTWKRNAYAAPLAKAYASEFKRSRRGEERAAPSRDEREKAEERGLQS